MIKTVLKKSLKAISDFLFGQDDMALLYDFEKCKREIQQRNKQEFFNRIIPVIRKTLLRTDNLLISEEQAKNIAKRLFDTAKELGDIDCLNRVVER